jgi:hypothetical protein
VILFISASPCLRGECFHLLLSSHSTLEVRMEGHASTHAGSMFDVRCSVLNEHILFRFHNFNLNAIIIPVKIIKTYKTGHNSYFVNKLSLNIELQALLHGLIESNIPEYTSIQNIDKTGKSGITTKPLG